MSTYNIEYIQMHWNQIPLSTHLFNISTEDKYQVIKGICTYEELDLNWSFVYSPWPSFIKLLKSIQSLKLHILS